MSSRLVVVDASAFAAVIFSEPGYAEVDRQLHGAAMFAPPLLGAELANIAWKKARRRPGDTGQVMAALAAALTDDRINWFDVDPVGAALVALETGASTYDASYLWLAGHLGAELITLDRNLIAASADRR
jgi:predicted nucleic acid-binding protein